MAAVCCGHVQHACDDGDYDEDYADSAHGSDMHDHDGNGHADDDGDYCAHNDADHLDSACYAAADHMHMRRTTMICTASLMMISTSSYVDAHNAADYGCCADVDKAFGLYC